MRKLRHAWSSLGAGLSGGNAAAWEQLTRRAVLKVNRGTRERASQTRYLILFKDGASLDARIKQTSAAEARFYARLGASFPIALPEILYTEESGPEGLVIYRSLPPGKPSSKWTGTDVCSVLTDLAALHAAFWQALPEGLVGLMPVLEQLSQSFEQARSGVALLKKLGGWPGFISMQTLSQMEALLADESRLLAPLQGLPLTLIHGDPWLPNWILLPDRRVLLDWQTAAAGPGIWDVAYLVEMSGEAGEWPTPQAEEALAVYWGALQAHLPVELRQPVSAVDSAYDAAAVIQVLTRWPAYAAGYLAPLRAAPFLAPLWKALPERVRYAAGSRAVWAGADYYQGVFQRFSARALKIYGK